MLDLKKEPGLERFYKQLNRIFEEVKKPDLLKGFREKAYDHFLEMGLPEKKQEAFQYFPLGRLYDELFFSSQKETLSLEDIKPHVLPECQNACLVFINGHFSKTLSTFTSLPKSVVIIPLLEAISSYGSFLQNRWSRALREERDPLSLLNLALHPEGAFVYIPPKIELSQPIQLLSITTQKGFLALPRTQLFLASQSSVKWISTYHGPGISNAAMDLVLEDSARFSLSEIVRQKEGWHFSSLRASLKRDSNLSVLSAITTSRTVRQSYEATLQGENACVSLEGSWMLKEKQEAHTHVRIEHEEPYCRSMQKFKGVLDGLSRSSFEGKIFVQSKAQKTEAYQLNNNLILSDHAQANSKPNLEILADDVKASHGATISQLSKEALFYLKSRGISEEEAKHLLITGYMEEVICQLPLSSLKYALRQDVANFFSPSF